MRFFVNFATFRKFGTVRDNIVSLRPYFRFTYDRGCPQISSKI